MMNKTKKISLIAAVIAIITIALIASIYCLTGAPNQNSVLPKDDPPQAQVRITGHIPNEKSFSIAELSQMPLKNVTHTIKGETATYLGVSLLDLLNSTEASWDTGLITVISADGFNKTINFYQVYNSTQYSNSEIILAFVKNGNWITDTTEGPLKLITPTLESFYNIKAVSELNLRPWTINITGDVSTPFVLTSQDINSLQIKTVQAALAPGGEPQRTSSWTGISLSSILQASGASPNATKVTIYAIDGYSRDYTITQVNDLDILIGYQENGAYLTPVNGQPYRLIVPIEDFKWGQYWVRWVSQIIVS